MGLFEARGLSVAYGAADDPGVAPMRLDAVSFSLERGRIYDLTGPSGAGKSMLIRACAQMMAVEGGCLLLDGVASDAMAVQEWRRRVCLVPQHASLVAGTVRDNLLLPWTLKVNRSRPLPTDGELRALLDAALLDVSLDRDGAKLSGGQAARVALLRVFAAKPEVLLLDEVDAALDDASAQAVGALTAEVVGQEATCLRIRHRSPDGRAFGTFHLEGGCLSYAEGGRGRMPEAVPASEGPVAASPNSGLDRSPAASPGSGLVGSPAASSTRAPERPSASAPTEGGES